jgi:hypothetical protein
MQALEAARLETAAAWEQDGQASGAVRAIIGAVDAPFLARLILVFMDLSTGSLLLEQVADDRTSATWKALVDERLKVLDVCFISSLPVMQRPACMAWADKRPVQIVWAVSDTRPDHDVVDDACD